MLQGWEAMEGLLQGSEWATIVVSGYQLVASSALQLQQYLSVIVLRKELVSCSGTYFMAELCGRTDGSGGPPEAALLPWLPSSPPRILNNQGGF